MPRLRNRAKTEASSSARADAPTCNQSCTPVPVLPFEILGAIVSTLDPITDRATLITLSQVSTSLWECAASQLYRHLTVTGEELDRLLDSGIQPWYRGRKFTQTRLQSLRRKGESRLTERTRRCLGFVRRLQLLGPPQNFPKIWDLTVSNTPLFPHAVEVIIDPYTGPYRSWDPPVPSYEADVYIFDAVDVCINSHNTLDELELLPARCFRTISLHGNNPAHVLRREHALQWRMCRIYAPRHLHFTRELEQRWNRPGCYRSPSFAPANPTQLCSSVDSIEPDELVIQGLKSYYNLQSEWNEEMKIVLNDDCPSCEVCGECDTIRITADPR